MQPSLLQDLPELTELERLIELAGNRARVKTVGHTQCGEWSFPLYVLSFGSQDPQAPCLGLFGGVHGLERIGTHVLLAYLRTMIELLSWDQNTRQLLEHTRVVFMPLINPGGMYLTTRSNPNGVDLMRNGPVHGEKMSPLALFAGHRLSPRLPWYRGAAGAPMEVEAQALCDVVREEIFRSKVAITVDVHSGFGTKDRLWFPYAKTKKPFALLPEMFAFKSLLDRTYPNHVYIVEPQSKQYTTHGDLWDYLYDEQRHQENAGTFIPLTLELGSWVWAKKNVRQIFSLLGAFNPLIPHRLQRTLRRHLLFFEFAHRAVFSPESWANLSRDRRDPLKRHALEFWYS